MNFRTGLSLALALLAVAQGAHAGTIGFGTPTIESNQYALPVTLSGGDGQVSAMDFRIQYDPTVFRPVSIAPGPMALQANKQVIGNGPTPGEYIVIMHGINQNAVGNGEVAKVIFERIDGGESASRLNIVEPTLADVNGSELPASGSGRSVGTRSDTEPGGGGGNLPGEPETPAEPDTNVPEPTPETPLPGEPGSDSPAAGEIGVMASAPMLDASSGLPGIVIPKAKRPAAGGTEPASQGAEDPGAPANRTGAAVGVGPDGLPAAGGDRAAVGGQRGFENTTETPTQKKIAEMGRGDGRIETARLDTGRNPIESVNGRVGLAGASANAGDAEGLPRTLVAGLALSALLAVTAMIVLRRRLFR